MKQQTRRKHFSTHSWPYSRLQLTCVQDVSQSKFHHVRLCFYLLEQQYVVYKSVVSYYQEAC